MQLLKQLSSLGDNAIPRQVLLSMLTEYKRPNDKISELCAAKILMPLKRGLFILHPDFSGNKSEVIALANVLFGPSYVSLDYALSFHGAIPERVKTVSSVTTKMNKIIKTPLSTFTYTHLPLPYYSFGIENREIQENIFVLIASPEKALCDKIICTRSLQLRSIKEVQSYFEDDIRIDAHWLKQLDVKVIKQYAVHAPKKNSLDFIVKMIHSL